MPGRSGRRPGSGTRETILEAAREAFTSHGYDRTTIRGIARGAGVDPALVHHYFGGKEQLFTAALELPFEPARVADLVLGGPPEQAGERLVTFFLQVWEQGGARNPMLALLRSALTNEQAAEMLRSFVTEALVVPVAERLGGPHQRVRPVLAASQMIGAVTLRYVLRVEPLASLPPEELVAVLAPTVQRYLTGDLGPVTRTRADAPASGGGAADA